MLCLLANKMMMMKSPTVNYPTWSGLWSLQQV